MENKRLLFCFQAKMRAGRLWAGAVSRDEVGLFDGNCRKEARSEARSLEGGAANSSSPQLLRVGRFDAMSTIQYSEDD